MDRQTNKAADALKGKAKGAKLSKAVIGLLAGGRRGGAEGEQRLLAVVAERITADPVKELELFDVFFELERQGTGTRTRLLALLSAVAVFRDLVPGYRIREPTEQERATQRSKEVLSLERHELLLLQTYRRLLPALEAGMRRDALAVAPALAALVRAAGDFNYRQRLIGTAVRHASSPQEPVRRVVAEGLSDMVGGDQRLEACREVVLAVGRLAQGHAAATKKGGNGVEGDRGGLQHELIKVLLHLPVGRAEAAGLHEDRGAKDADEDVRRGLAESSISLSSEQLRKAEAELLYEVFVVYLRILRQRHLHGRELLASVLAGLARWGQQVNLELLMEILGELKLAVQEAISRADELVALQGLNCALVLFSGPAQALVTDASWLTDSLISALALALPSMHSVHSESDEWPPPRCFSLEDSYLHVSDKELAGDLETGSVPALVLRCLDAALKCPQGFGKASDSALAALIEHLFLLAAGADAHVGLAVLREAALLLRKHIRLHTLLDVDGGLFGLGGVTDRSISVLWHLVPQAFSLAPELKRAGCALPTAIPQRRILLADLFPARDTRIWLQSEFVKHLAALAQVPAPRAHAAGRKGAASMVAFLSEAELQAACRVPGAVLSGKAM